ncbi:MAG: WbuC family cupin fold metalloprotein [Syntrophus sp. (in: bacteria)]
MNFKEISEEVLFTTDVVTKIDAADIEFLKCKAMGNSRKRIRVCCHLDIRDTLHEMLIVHAKGAYVRPHEHREKSESFHIIQGELYVVIFRRDGSIAEAIKMNAFSSGEVFYYRLSESFFHTIIPISDYVVFHEVTNGPFKREDMVFAPWAPTESESAEQLKYLHDLETKIKKFAI